MTLFLLDTNAVSDLINTSAGRIELEIRRVGLENVCTSVIVSAEVAYGVEWKKRVVLSQRVDQIFKRLKIVPFERPADQHYGALRAHLRLQGQPIGPNDLLIAAHALALGATLVTDNLREFSRVPGLAIENWLRPSEDQPPV